MATLPDAQAHRLVLVFIRFYSLPHSERIACCGDIVHAQDCISANAVESCIRTIHHLDTFTTPELAQCHERAVVGPYARICVSAAVAREVALSIPAKNRDFSSKFPSIKISKDT